MFSVLKIQSLNQRTTMEIWTCKVEVPPIPLSSVSKTPRHTPLPPFPPISTLISVTANTTNPTCNHVRPSTRQPTLPRLIQERTGRVREPSDHFLAGTGRQPGLQERELGVSFWSFLCSVQMGLIRSILRAAAIFAVGVVFVRSDLSSALVPVF